MSHFAFSGNRLHTCHDTTSHGPFSFWFATHPWSDEKIYRIYRILDWIVKRRILHFFVGSRIATHRNSSFGAHSRTKDRVVLWILPCTEITARNWNKNVIRLLHRWKFAHWVSKVFPSTLLFVSFLKKSDFSPWKDIFSSKGRSFSTVTIGSSLIGSIDILFSVWPSRRDSKNPTTLRKHFGKGFVSSKVPKYIVR